MKIYDLRRLRQLPVRMKDIADDLGVSVMTVSKALRNHSDVSQKTRDRVLMRTRELNYQPDLDRPQHGHAPDLPRRPGFAGPDAFFLRRSCQGRHAKTAASRLRSGDF